jgi:hypothetical protein
VEQCEGNYMIRMISGEWKKERDVKRGGMHVTERHYGYF